MIQRRPIDFISCLVVCIGCFVLPVVASGQSLDRLTLHRVKAEPVEYLGKPAIRLLEDGVVENGEAFAIVEGADFANGSIDVDMAGRPAVGAQGAARGFIGMALHLGDGTFEYVYLRPTNGRAEDQVRRNHSTQYSAFPDFPFSRAREEAPEKYESYVDLAPGMWTHYRLVVEGVTARLFVNGATQPTLVVNDLKLGHRAGGVALWIGPGTEGYFSGLTVQRQGVSPVKDTRASRSDALMRSLHEAHRFNGEILVAQRGNVIYQGAFGPAEPGAGRSYSLDTPSCLASLSKPFTALAIQMFAEHGRLRYDDPIGTYVSGLADLVGRVTIRQLLTHTSGIPDYPTLLIEHPGLTSDEVVSAVRRMAAPSFTPGERYAYSNTGYVLLGAAVERLAGVPLAQFLQTRIFGPLGMTHTFVLTRPEQKTMVVARGYDEAGKPDDYEERVTGSTGVYSTVADLLRFDQALYTDALVSQATLADAFRPGSVRTGQTTYGLGWNIVPGSVEARIWHQGNTAGFRAFIERRLTSRITVIMLTNGGDTDRMTINDAIQRVLAE
jgi:CubicO group peptidase (beta-lactamase class C family)